MNNGGKATIQANENSNYLIGSKQVNLIQQKYNLNNLTSLLKKHYQIGSKLSTVISDVDQELAKVFANSWLPKPVLNQDYEFRGINFTFNDPNDKNQYLRFAGNQSLAPTAINNSLSLIGSANIEVGTIKSEGGNETFNLSSSGYLLQADSSTYTVVPKFSNNTTISKPLSRTTPTNPIKANEILGMSKNFLVTTRGLFIQSQLIESSIGLNLTPADIVIVTDYLVITTKGS
jgi:hypothetical protein